MIWGPKFDSVDYLLSLAAAQSVFVQIAKYICPNSKIYLSKILNVSVQIKNIVAKNMNPVQQCQHCKIHLSKLPNLFVKIALYICPNCLMYLSKLQNVFV